MVILTVNDIQNKVIPIAKKYQFSEVYLFGSYARGNATERSDVDLAFESRAILSYFDIFKIESELEEALGKEVDLVPVVQLADAKTPIGKYMFEKGFQKEKRLIA
ncbi:type VII toxin-antitoxin system MntA family adenylyltransferase antitoxin [Lactococcus lactis]|uniref:type VII toxin-antitoxin system MntA family adenylyltransferase antitoxin n=1 Tax=Lactococcus lactis TaxID=1358 RepID=UPI0019122E90|nr:nucleotidyltransferase domain-containing protein [Lactococcus lactis]WDA68456.1 nucleotidyltransferase domain-containing protein [Lactococcus lactis]